MKHISLEINKVLFFYLEKCSKERKEDKEDAADDNGGTTSRLRRSRSRTFAGAGRSRRRRRRFAAAAGAGRLLWTNIILRSLGLIAVAIVHFELGNVNNIVSPLDSPTLNSVNKAVFAINNDEGIVVYVPLAVLSLAGGRAFNRFRSFSELKIGTRAREPTSTTGIQTTSLAKANLRP